MRKFIPLIVLICLSAFVNGQTGSFDDSKTESPYFLVNSDNPEEADMPLKATDVDVHIAGIIADVSIKQIYVNESEQVLEAIYVFPGSVNAAVYDMTMFIGHRKLKAVIREKEQARKEYETAKEEGKTTSLLEQHRPNVFQMNVANILPGDSIVVEMNYTEHIESLNGIYEFVFPTVVGPRYTENNEEWIQRVKDQNSKKPDADFNIELVINAGLPLQFVKSPSHMINVEYPMAEKAVVTLHSKDKTALDIVSPETMSENFWIGRDYVIEYGLRGELPKSGLLTYEQDDENFFLLMIQPPEKLETEDIPKREYIFIVDVSGSMGGFPLSVSKKLLRNLLSNLKPEDKFNVMLFAAGNSMLSEKSLFATEKNINKAINVIDKQRGGGGTQIYPAIKKALLMNPGNDYSRVFIPITDGYVSIEKDLFKLVKENLDEANMFAFGIGSSVNRYLIDGLAHAGMGEPFMILNLDLAEEQGKKFLDLIRNPVLTDISVDFGDFDVYDLNTEKVPDLFSQRPIIVYGKYKGKPKGKITVKGIRGNSEYTEIIQAQKFEKDETRSLRYLWARNRIQYWDDFAQYYEDISKQKEEITKLGLKYNLLTDYTSFIAVDKYVRIKTNKNSDQGYKNTPYNNSNNALNNLVGVSSGSEINEVVVTALGVSKDVKSLGYSQTETHSANISSNSLQGKVAGVHITNSSGTPGSLSRVIMRGGSSMSGGCGPLFVVDDVPVQNSVNTSNAGFDFGNGRNDINPDDIGSISVLKGNAATALYGSRAANGVILITTKKPANKVFSLNFSSSFSKDIVDKLPQLQNIYAQGRTEGGSSVWHGAGDQEIFSWGPKISDLENSTSGDLVSLGTGNGVKAGSYNPYSFLKNGYTLNNTISLSGRKQGKWNYYISTGNQNQEGFIPECGMNMYFLNMKSEIHFTERFSTDVSGKFTNSRSDFIPKINSYSGIFYNMLTTSPSFDIENNMHTSYNGGITDNPIFSVKKNLMTDKNNHLTIHISPEIELGENVSLKAKASFLKNSDQNILGYAYGSAVNPIGEYTEYSEDTERFLSELTVAFTPQFDNFGTDLTGGVGYTYEKMNCNEISAIGLSESSTFNFENYTDLNKTDISFEKNKFHAYFNTVSHFRNKVFLTLNGRGDENYPGFDKPVLFSGSASISVILSDIIPGIKRYLSFGKLFASYGTKDTEAPLYFDPTFFTQEMFDLHKPLYGKRRVLFEDNLTVEHKNEFEAGLDFRILRGRLNFDLAYYSSKTRDKYVPTVINNDFVQISNAGILTAEGLEIGTSFEIIQMNKLRLWTGFSFTKEHNTLSDIGDEYPVGIALSELNGFSSRMYEGESYGVFYGTKYLRNENGEMVIGSDGFPLLDEQKGIIGDPNPDFILGMHMKLTYRNFELAAQFDYKKGGDVWNGTKNTLNYFGVSEETRDLRETEGYIFEGVSENGEMNTIPVNFTDFDDVMNNRWTRYGITGVAEDGIEDGTWFRLNNVIFSYSIPRKYSKKLRIRDVQFSLFARNLFTITEYSGVTPDTEIVRAQHGRGIDYFNLPSVKSYGVKLSFGI